jgi:hypothetical protein
MDQLIARFPKSETFLFLGSFPNISYCGFGLIINSGLVNDIQRPVASVEKISQNNSNFDQKFGCLRNFMARSKLVELVSMITGR